MPGWAARRWGLLRALAIVFTAVGLVGVPLLTTIDPETDGAIWIVVVGVAAAGAASAQRAAAVRLDGDGSNWRVPAPVARAMWGDAGWSFLLLAVALSIRGLVRMLGGGSPAELLLAVVFAAVWGVAWLVGAIPAFVIGLAVFFVVRAVAPSPRRRDAAAWPLVLLLVAVIAFLVLATLSLTLLDVPSDRFAEFLVRDLDPYTGAEAAVAWGTRASVVTFLVAAAALVIGRARSTGER